MPDDVVPAYKSLCEAVPDPGLYNAPWWLDLTCGAGGWTVLFHADTFTGEKSALPMMDTRIRGLRALVTPPMTQWVSATGGEHQRQPVIGELLRSVPRVPIFDLQIHGMPPDALAGHGLKAALRYSYVLSASPDIGSIRSGYSEGLRRNLREARDAYQIDAETDPGILVNLMHASFAQQKDRAPGWVDSVVPRVVSGILARRAGAYYVARDDRDILAAVCVAWDKAVTYYIAGGRTARPGSASAHALLLDHAIAGSVARGTAFDFEGSMHPGIANFFQSFGARPEPFTRLTRYLGPGKVWALFH